MRKMLGWQPGVLVLTLALVVALGSGCKSRKGEIALDMTDGAGSGSTYEQSTGTGLPSLDQDSILFDPNHPDGLRPVYFDFDSFSLRSDALATLSRNAELIKGRPNVIVQIAGHCDERGTSEYNFALGERRALSVREHLMRLGVSGDRLLTISYGEERPAEYGSNEAAWAKNRRCEFAQAQALR